METLYGPEKGMGQGLKRTNMKQRTRKAGPGKKRNMEYRNGNT
jgi:hypothetical protein